MFLGRCKRDCAEGTCRYQVEKSRLLASVFMIWRLWNFLLPPGGYSLDIIVETYVPVCPCSSVSAGFSIEVYLHALTSHYI
jgi:hypothetical protein